MSEMIRREERPDPSLVPPLDPTLLHLSNEQLSFLQLVVCKDEKELRERIIEVQKTSYEKYPYPCIRSFHFVSIAMRDNPIYENVLEMGKRGSTVFLDMGCCMGTDLRKLVLDGYPAENVVGVDIRQEYIDIGHQLYHDEDTCKIRFFSGDVFDIPLSSAVSTQYDVSLGAVTSLSQLQDHVTHIYTGALFHLFDEATQYAIALRLATLLQRTRGATIFGRHSALEVEGMIKDPMARVRYGHSPKSWPRLWKRVFTELDGVDFAENKVAVEAELREHFGSAVDTRMMYWSVSIA